MPARGARLDLGGRVVRLRALSGHPPSDLVLELEEPHAVWCGDLVWNGIVPNYVDAIPSRLSASVRKLLDARAAVYVPGHGALTDAAGLGPYIDLLDDIEAAARRAVERGVPAADAARDYRPPTAVAEWALFSPGYWRVAFEAWERELRGGAPDEGLTPAPPAGPLPHRPAGPPPPPHRPRPAPPAAARAGGGPARARRA